MKRVKAPSFLLSVSGGLLAVSAALTAAYVLDIRSAGAASGGGGEETDRVGEAMAEVVEAAETFLDTEVELRLEGASTKRTWRDIGLEVKEAAAEREASRFAAAGELPEASAYAGNPAGDEVPVRADPARVREALDEVRDELERPPQSARLDLENREVHGEESGWGIDPYRSLSAIELAARAAEPTVELEGAEIPPSTTVDDLGTDDISEVMGEFSTNYNTHQPRRVSNLKRAAAEINGVVLQPGEEFSFNEVLGERSEAIGYKVAPVISRGEFADGTAGGICQISSTLHSAAFFAGLEITQSLPHSRPIGYIPMALDATVVYPFVDVAFRNDYDFPVAIHYSVAQGEAKVEILGPGRPYDKVRFVREIRDEVPFESVTREDESMPVGSMEVDQHGYLGYEVTRYRHFYEDGELVKRDRWDLEYSPVTEYVRVGVNPDPNLQAEVDEGGPRNPNPPRQARQVIEQ